MADPHHFYLMGAAKYADFQARSAEKLLTLLSGHTFCPFAECGAGFTAELERPDEQVQCPECLRHFCAACRFPGRCVCEQESCSLRAVREVSKPCPRCQVPTERHGGCAHMRCPNCAFEWCFLCGVQWSDECQFDHWFE